MRKLSLQKRNFCSLSGQKTSSSSSPSSKPAPISSNTKGAPLNQIISTTFDQKVKQYEHRDFFRVPWADIRWTFLETQQRVDAYATGFETQNKQEKELVSVLLPEGAVNAMIPLSLAKIGLVTTMFPSRIKTKEEFCALMDYIKPRSLIWRPDTYYRQIWDDMKEICHEFEWYPSPFRRGEQWWCDRFPGLNKVINADSRHIPEARFITLRDLNIYNNFLGNQEILKAAASLTPNDRIFIYTKLLEGNKVEAWSYTHNDFAITANRVGELLSLEVGDRVCLSLPLGTQLGHAIGLWSVFTHGAFVVLPTEVFNADEHLRSFVEESCNTLIASPEYLGELIKNSKKLATLKKVLIVSETPVPSELIQKVKDLKVFVVTMNPREKCPGQKV